MHETPEGEDRMAQFKRDLCVLAPQAGRGDYVFRNPSGERLGFAQLTFPYSDAATLHRLWVDRPGSGNGTVILRALCALADRHGIGIVIKPLPFGQKPYPLSREQLMVWYARFGFEGTRRKMTRKPRQTQSADKLQVLGL